MKLTPMQQVAAELSNTDTCVVAGPGSGKTTVLIEHYRLLVESGVPPARILAITFTEKATLHMRKHLERAFAANATLLRLIRRAHVSTVHGFCARLLRENAIAAGIDPEFRVMTEPQSDRLRERAASDALDRLFASRPAETRRLLESLAAPDIAQALLEVQEALRAAGESTCRLREIAPPDCFERASSRVDALCREVANARTPRWDRKHIDAAREVLAWSDCWNDLLSQEIGLDHLRHLCDFDFKLTQIPSGPGRDALRTLRDEVLAELRSATATRCFASSRSTLLDAFDEFDTEYRNRKRASGFLDFTDLEEYAVALLRSEEGVRERIRNQFDQILMDEFQDTNGVQSILLSLIRPEGRFYAVGDINQSIYGFRHADPEVFRQYRGAAGRVAELRENWRSRKEILAAVSTIREGAPGIEQHSFVPARDFAAKAEPCVEVIAAIGATSSEALSTEAAWVAQRILELHGCLQTEKGTARYSDMALLFRSTTPMDVFSDALDRAGIPFTIRAGRGFYEAREITDLIHYLRVLANPRDELSLAAVLRSPFAGLPDELLMEAIRTGPLCDALQSGVLVEFGSAIEEERTALRKHGVERVLLAAMDRCGYQASLSPRQRANVEKFVVRLREILQTQSLDDVIDDLERLRQTDPREPEAEQEEVMDAVVLQTIHSAKGLEFPIVFLPALHTGVPSNREAIQYGAGAGLAVKWRHPGTAASAPDSLFARVTEDRKKRENEEADRLLYVAMTRAEEHLVMSYAGSGNPEGWAKRVAGQLSVNLQTPGAARVENVAPLDGEPFAVRIQVATKPPDIVRAGAGLESASHQAEFIARPEVRGQYDSAVSATSLAIFEECPRRYALSRQPAGYASNRVEEEMETTDAPDASEVGRQVHALLAGWNVEAGDEARELASRFRESELGQRAAETMLREHEYSFVFALDGVVLSGQIDLWFEHSGELILVDYKTDEVSAEEAREHARIHELQLQLYGMALERMHGGRPPDHTFIYLLRPNVAVPVRTNRARVEAAIRQLREAQEKGIFPMNVGPRCLRCPHFRGSCPSDYGRPAVL